MISIELRMLKFNKKIQYFFYINKENEIDEEEIADKEQIEKVAQILTEKHTGFDADATNTPIPIGMSSKFVGGNEDKKGDTRVIIIQGGSRIPEPPKPSDMENGGGGDDDDGFFN